MERGQDPVEVTSHATAPSPRAPVECAHCGLSVPPGLVVAQAPRQFCCSGCRTVYAVLHEEGLERYYDYRERSGAAPRQARVSGKSFEHFDEASFIAANCRPLEGGLLAVDLYLEGVHCSACLWLVERTTVLVPGVAAATLELGRSIVHLVYDPTAVRLSTLAQRLDSLGYPPHPYRVARLAAQRRLEDRAMLARLGVAGAAAGNVMLFATALYGGAFQGIEPAHEQFFRWASLMVAAPAVLWSGAVFHRGAWGALRSRTAHMDLPLSLGILAGFGWGAVNVVRGIGDVYFDSVATLVFLLLVGRWLQRSQQRRASDAAELVTSLAPATARLIDGEGSREVAVEAMVVGARVEVRAGEAVPVDGTVLDGRSAVDLSLLTGESRPVDVAPGERVHAGSVNLSGRLVVEVTATGESTRVGRLLREVELAASRRVPIVELADRISGIFVVAVLGLAVVTGAVWAVLDAARALDIVVALLVVSCPCALGLATPLAVSAAIGQAARAGILIKGGDALERLARPALFVFDKTGTLTEGRLRLVAWEGDAALRAWVRAAEEGSAHPIAVALGRDLDGEASLEFDAVEHELGAGLVARRGDSTLLVGAPAWVAARASPFAPWVVAALERHTAEAHTPVAVALDGEVRALALLADPVRAEAPAALAALHARGHRLAVLSGDHPAVVAAVARSLRVPLVEARGAVSPEEKLAFIQALAAQGPVVMIGDGANDAAALAAASVGIAVHGGAEASLAAADVFATTPGISPVLRLVEGSARTLAVIHRNVAFSLVYNVVGVSLAMSGLLNPLIAALLMPVSSVTVITSSFRARYFR